MKQSEQTNQWLSEYQMDIISHSLGIDFHSAKNSNRPKDKLLPDKFYRNYFVAGKSGKVREEFNELENNLIATSREQFGDAVFHITETGIELFRKQFKKEVTDSFIMPSKSVIRYQEFMSADIGLTFAEFNGIKLPVYEYNSKYMVRMVSTKYPSVKGEYFKFKKDAKISYKKALRSFKLNNRNETTHLHIPNFLPLRTDA